ncbi:MAG: hypothetical protein ACLQDY_23355 [Streptosporangiaceae bacterium]
MPAQLRVLSARDVHALLPYGECAQAMREVLAALARGEAYQPLRTVLQPPGAAGLMALMPCYAGAVDGAAIVVTATNSATPVLRRAWIAPGTHVNAVGACLPAAREDLAAAALAWQRAERTGAGTRAEF